jgi:ubiquinone biosynthesis protein
MIRLFEIARRFNMEIQPQLVLLEKTLFNIEGLGRELYPQLDLWKTAHPILRRWMDEQLGPRAMLKNLREDLPQIREALRELPGVVHYLSDQISHGNLQFKVQAPELREIRDQLRRQQKQRYWLAVGATTIITGTLILTWGFLPALAWTLITAGVLATFAGRPRN